MSGGKAALPIWIDYMETVIKDRKVVNFPVPPGIEWVEIDLDTGLRASEYTKRSRTYPFIKGTAPEKKSPPPVDFDTESFQNTDDKDEDRTGPGMDATMYLDN